MKFKSGFVTVVGRPNVGKSTLTNNYLGEKISIMSPKPQTTRNTIRAILTDENSQIVFLDTPGIHTPKNKLGEYMVNSAKGTFKDVDCIIYMIEPITEKIGNGDLEIINSFKDLKTPIILAINKCDSYAESTVFRTISAYDKVFPFKAIVPISALKGDNTDRLHGLIKDTLKEGPMFFDKDEITDQPEKVIISEYIREKVLLFLREEIPHGVGIEVVSFKARKNSEIIDIEATIYCEKKSHKGMIIGKNGSMLKKIGTSSRRDIEKLLGTKVYMTLWVKIKEDWRNSDFMLKSLGYES